MEVGFEDGCGWMVKVQIRYGIKVFFPVRKETWLIGNNETIGWDERFTMPAPNEILTVYACSPGTKYDHNVFIRIMTLPKGFYFLESLLDKLYRLFERII
jgi:formylmethanofuran dehydrogenase subunit A